VNLTLSDGSQRSGQVLEVSGSKAVVQVRPAPYLGAPLCSPCTPLEQVAMELEESVLVENILYVSNLYHGPSLPCVCLVASLVLSV